MMAVHWPPVIPMFHLQCSSTTTGSSHQPDKFWTETGESLERKKNDFYYETTNMLSAARTFVNPVDLSVLLHKCDLKWGPSMWTFAFSTLCDPLKHQQLLPSVSLTVDQSHTSTFGLLLLTKPLQLNDSGGLGCMYCSLQIFPQYFYWIKDWTFFCFNHS